IHRTAVGGPFALTESLAISEYLDEIYPAPGYVRLLPAQPVQRARARQIMLYLRMNLQALREARPTSTVFGRPNAKPMPEAARAEADELVRIALALIPEEAGPIFGAWSIADADLALTLMRLVANQDVTDRKLVQYATAQFDRTSVRRFVAHLPTSR
ncbi:MAG TPA: glutathione transferase, partial [Kofleriaceae bacterium]